MSDHVSDEQLSLLLDGELSLTAREAVSRHLADCPTCAARHDQLVEVTAKLRLHPALTWTDATTETTVSHLAQQPRRSTRPRMRRAALVAVAVAVPVALLVLAIGTAAHAFGRFAALAGGGVVFVSPRTLLILAGLALLGLLAYPLAHTR